MNGPKRRGWKPGVDRGVGVLQYVCRRLQDRGHDEVVSSFRGGRG